MISTQDAWQRATDSEAKVELDDTSLNPHFAYDDEDAKQRHQVWYLDAVTALNQMRVARALGLQTFALWRLGFGRCLALEDLGQSTPRQPRPGAR